MRAGPVSGVGAAGLAAGKRGLSRLGVPERRELKLAGGTRPAAEEWQLVSNQVAKGLQPALCRALIR